MLSKVPSCAFSGISTLTFMFTQHFGLIYNISIWMASCTSGLTHIKKTRKIYVIDSNNLINIRVSHSGLDHLVTDVVIFLC